MRPKNEAHYILGKGIVKFDRFDADGLPTGLRDLGNTSKFTVIPDYESLGHFSARRGIRKNRKADVVLSGAIVEFTLEEYDSAAIMLALLGQDFNVPLVRRQDKKLKGELVFVGVNDVGPNYTANFWNVELVPTSDISPPIEAWGPLTFRGRVFTAVADHPSSPYFDLTVTSMEEADMDEAKGEGFGPMFTVEVAKNGWIIREQGAEEIPVLAMHPDELVRALMGGDVEFEDKGERVTGKTKKKTKARK